MSRKRTVGVWFSAKKKKKVNVEELRELFNRIYNVELREIDLDDELEKQGPFDAIVHKVTDLMIDTIYGNQIAAKRMARFEAYLERHPETVMVDPLMCLRKLIKRFETYKLIRETKICSEGNTLHIPSFTFIETRDRKTIQDQMSAANVRFPFVCKKNIAHGAASHKMSIIFNEEGLDDVDPPCVAQTFIDHNALLYKIYVIADEYHMVKRPSLKNFSKPKWKNHKTIFFNSHNISSADCERSDLTRLDDGDGAPIAIDERVVRTLTKQLYEEIGMTLYGVDIIVCPKTKQHYVIDVNVFPGYDGVDEFLSMMTEKVMRKIKTSESTEVFVKSKSAPPTNALTAPQTNGVHPELHMNGSIPSAARS